MRRLSPRRPRSQSAAFARSRLPAVGLRCVDVPRAAGLPAFYSVPDVQAGRRRRRARTSSPRRSRSPDSTAPRGASCTYRRPTRASRSPVTGLRRSCRPAPHPSVAGRSSRGRTARTAWRTRARRRSRSGTSDIPPSLINDVPREGLGVRRERLPGRGHARAPALHRRGLGGRGHHQPRPRRDASVPGADTSKTWVEWGHSEGGQTAMFVDHIARRLRARASTSRASSRVRRRRSSSYIDGFLKTSPYAFYILMVAFGFNAYYGNNAAPLDTVLTTPARS